MRTCIVCGEEKVTPITEADVKIFVIEMYDSCPICEECYDKTDPSVYKADELPF
jgi:transcription elongation factor Elf1